MTIQTQMLAKDLLLTANTLVPCMMAFDAARSITCIAVLCETFVVRMFHAVTLHHGRRSNTYALNCQHFTIPPPTAKGFG